MREAQEKVIGGKTYSITPAPARRAMRVLPLIGKGVFNLSGDESDTLARALLEGLSRVDGAELWPIFDGHFAGDMPALLEVLSFAIEVSTGFKPAADGIEKVESPSVA